MKVVKSALLTGALLGALGAMTVATTASADVACNRWHECWHVRDHIDYPANLGVTFHDETWATAHHRGWRWRQDRNEHGYYRNGIWIAF
jgi:hypothetical protein